MSGLVWAVRDVNSQGVEGVVLGDGTGQTIKTPHLADASPLRLAPGLTMSQGERFAVTGNVD